MTSSSSIHSKLGAFKSSSCNCCKGLSATSIENTSLSSISVSQRIILTGPREKVPH